MNWFQYDLTISGSGTVHCTVYSKGASKLNLIMEVMGGKKHDSV
jgi:hypothetical protein